MFKQAGGILIILLHFCPILGISLRRLDDSKIVFCTTKRHVHLSVGPDASTSMTVSFSSGPCDALHSSSQASPGAVLIGTDPKRLNRIVMEEHQAKHYNATFISSQHQHHLHYVSEYQHHVTITGLKPNTKYYYKCIIIPYWANSEFTAQTALSGRVEVSGQKDDDYYYDDDEFEASFEDDDDDDESDTDTRRLRSGKNRKTTKIPEKIQDTIFSFHTAPPTGTYPTRLAIIGDVATLPSSKACLRVLARNIQNVSAVLLVGDIAYANGDHATWDEWFDMMDDFHFLRNKPLQVAAGNHEIDHDEVNGNIFQSYEARFLMPQIAPSIMSPVNEFIDVGKPIYPLPYEYGNSYYSFIYGPSHNIVLNSFASVEPDSIQFNWFAAELRRVNRTVTPWLTVTIHCPMYNTFKLHQHDPQLTNAKQHLESLMVDYKVNFVLSGHLHAYMRTHPVVYDQINATGPIHVILGNGGRNANAPYKSDEPEEWVAVRDHSTYGYGTLEFINATTARYDWILTNPNTKENAGSRFFYEPEENLSDSAYFQNQYLMTHH